MDFIVSLGVLSGFKLAALTWIYRRNRKVYVGTVSEIYMYPVKSGQVLRGLKQATLDKHGLFVQNIGDRHWVVSRNGERMNMNRIPNLARIRPSIEGSNLRLDAQGHEPLILPANPEVNESDIVTLQFNTVPQLALDCGDEAAAWLCKVLEKQNVRLNHSSSELDKRFSCHTAAEKPWDTHAQPHDEISFQDFVTCMIMSESSMDALNQRLEKKVSAVQFRPNIMVKGSEPFDEDNWKHVYIGNNVSLRFVDMCQRCLITVRDPESGVLDKQEQPLKELKKFRCMEPFGPHKPIMGIHTAYEAGGDIHVGDPIYVVRK